MNSTHISPDDPRLTAFALGELEPGEREAVEAAIKADPALQAAVSQIQALAGDLSEALAKEPAPLVPPAQSTESAHEPHLSPKVVRFPYFWVAGLAAACFAAVFVVLHRNGSVQREQALASAASKQNAQLEEVVAQVKEAEAAKTRGSLWEIELDKRSQEARVAGMPGTDSPEAAAEAEFKKRLRSEEEASRSRARQPRAAAPELLLADRAAPGSAAWGSSGMPVELASNSIMIPAAPPRSADSDVAAAVSRAHRQEFNTEGYANVKDNQYLDVTGNPLSTFSIDVDTASYANVRRFLADGRMPPKDAVRIEELVNYFPYRYSAPKDDKPFAAALEVAAAPWNPQHRLVRIGLKGREVPDAQRPQLNIVFLLDVSGSMDSPNKLPLVKESMRLLLERLKPTDRVAIVTYAGASGLALPSTPASKKQDILDSLEELRAGGSTNGAMGIQLAYDIAKANFIRDGANRVVLCTDGDFNVGVTNDGDLTRLIEEKAKSGVFLSVLGFGMGNYKDDKLERLADKGNGNYGYVDTSREAKKLLVDQLSGTLVTIAKDVKIQVEFNPAKVQSYRLIGYENRMLAKEDFNNDKIDAGEIGAGHTVTALYEVVPVGVASPVDAPPVDDLKYRSGKVGESVASSEMLTLKVRYKAPDSDTSSKLEFPLKDSGGSFDKASEDFKFAAAVAGFGMVLRESPFKGTATLENVTEWAEQGTSEDAGGYRREFVAMVRKARDARG